MGLGVGVGLGGGVKIWGDSLVQSVALTYTSLTVNKGKEIVP